jgi:hypothetical protein
MSNHPAPVNAKEDFKRVAMRHTTRAVYAFIRAIPLFLVVQYLAKLPGISDYVSHQLIHPTMINVLYFLAAVIVWPLKYILWIVHWIGSLVGGGLLVSIVLSWASESLLMKPTAELVIWSGVLKGDLQWETLDAMQKELVCVVAQTGLGSILAFLIMSCLEEFVVLGLMLLFTLICMGGSVGFLRELKRSQPQLFPEEPKK